MLLDDTFIFSTITTIFQSFWSDATGKIFIATVVAYSVSYMIFSGYISKFSGGYGGLLLSQAGFTALDFLALLPTVVLLLIQTLKTLANVILRFIIIFVFFPLIAFAITVYIRPPLENLASPLKGVIGVVALFTWILSFTLPIDHPRFLYKRRSIVIAILFNSSLLVIFALCLPLPSTLVSSQEVGASMILAEVFSETLAFFIVIIVVLLPSIIGQKMADIAIEQNLLSKINRVALKQPVALPGSHPTPVNTKSLELNSGERHWLFKKQLPIQLAPEVYSYTWTEEAQIFLITSFSRTMAVYFCLEKLEMSNKLIFLSNDIVLLLELQSQRDRSSTK